ncbi:MAG: trehalose-6-phosphate synthase [Fibrobacterota bacterium]|nr:trehalose-6-phosphate synthase [Fibrobacterota bacterium]QQS04329.1 MAG: trehalose-6-phosphate synthase [Fibrobacterota bacterium]
MNLFKAFVRSLATRLAMDPEQPTDAPSTLPPLDELVGDRKLIVVSNRGPLQHEHNADGSIVAKSGAGGLATAMEPVLRACGGTWVCYGGGSADFEVADSFGKVELGPYWLRFVRIEEKTYSHYYNGYANGALWPLFHNAFSEPVFQAEDWQAYVDANRAFADAILAEAGDDPSLVIVNDYHLMLVPKLLKDSGKDLAVAMFWHIPWPGRRVLRICPNQEELYAGILGSDLVGFHAREHVVSFLETMDRSIEACINVEQQTVTRGGRKTYAKDFPISIDVQEVADGSIAGTWEDSFPELAQVIDDHLLFLGVDRLDYTKGIPHRISAFQKLLRLRPDLIGKVVLVQIASPSRFQIDSYQKLAADVRARCEAVNKEFGTADWSPVLLVEKNHDRSSLFRLYRRADVMLVTSLHDGMNLVCKEFIAAKAGLPGILVLSTFTGAADEFPEACLVNPFDIDGVARQLSAAIDRGPEASKEDLIRMGAHLRNADVYHWVRSLLLGMRNVLARKRADSSIT